MPSPLAEVIERVADAQADHDADAVAACVAPDYRSENPAYPERNFTGREQVRRNWRELFESTPDLRVDLLRSAVEGDVVWLEWHLQGTQTDGSSLGLRGAAIFGVDDDLLQWGRIYLEPVREADDETWEEFYRVEGADAG